MRKTVLYPMLLSYLAAFLLPLAMGVASAVIMTEEYRQLEIDNQALELSRTKIVTDANLANIHSIGQLLLNNENLHRLITAQAPLKSSDLMDVYRLRRSLVYQQGVNPLIKDIFIHFSYSDMVVSTQGLYSDGSFEAACDDSFGATYFDFIDITRFSGNFQYAFYPSIDPEKGNDIAVVCKYYNEKERANQAAVVILLDREAYMGLFAPRETQNGAVFFLYNPYINLSGYLMQGTLTDDQFAKYVGQTERIAEIDGKLVFQERSANVSSLRYVTVLPGNFAKGYLSRRLVIIWVMWAVCLLVGFVIIMLGVKRQYTPIEGLYRRLLQHAQSEEKDYENEYSAIEEGVKHLLSDLAGSHEQLQEKNSTLRTYVAESLIRGKYQDEESFRRVCSQYGLQMEGERYVQAMIALDDFAPLVHDRASEDDVPAQQTVMNLMAGALDSLLSEHCHVETAVFNDYLCVLMGGSVKTLNHDTLRNAFETLMQSLKDELSISISIAVGLPVQDCTQIREAYESAKEAMDYLQVTSATNRVLFHSEMEAEDAETIDWQKDIETQKIFFNNMTKGDFPKAYEAVCRLLPESLSASPRSLTLWQGRRLFVTGIVQDAFSRIPAQKVVGDKLRELDSAASVQEYTRALRDVFELAIQSAAEQKPASASLSDRIVAFVEKNYASPEISVALISETFEVSISSVSRSFKNATGVGLLDYIHMMRIRKAKQLLETTDLNVKDIAQQMGYISSLTMSRAFRRYEGITPTEYREMCGK